MKKSLLILLLTAISFSNLNSNPPKVLWTQHYGGVESDRTYNICETSDGGFLTCGQSNSFTSNFKTLLVRMDANGDTLWTKIIGDTALPEQVISMEETNDNCYIICGSKMLSDYKMHPYIFKMDSSGKVIWSKTYGLTKLAESGQYAFQTPDNGYFIAVRLQTGAFKVYKTDELGAVTDSAVFDWEFSDEVESVTTTHDGGYVVAGVTNSFAFSSEFDDMFMMKLNDNLDSLWLRLYGSNDSLDERLNHVIRTSDNGFLLVGAQAHTPKSQNSHDFYVVRTNSDGVASWSRKYGGAGHEVGMEAIEFPSGDFIICGTGAKGSGSFDAFVLRLNSSGDTIWTDYYGSPGIDQIEGIKQVKSGGYIITGYSYYYSANPNKSDLYFIRLDDDATGIDDFTMTTIDLNVSPNPFSESTTINYELSAPGNVKIDIFSYLGEKITTLVDEWQEEGRHSCELGVRNYELSAGMYYYRLQIGDRVESGKLIKL